MITRCLRAGRAALLLAAGSAILLGCSAKRDRGVDAMFSAHARVDSPGCAVGVYRAGAILFADGYGMANIEHAGKITPRTPFNVASLSKQVTAFAIQMLARDGRISLDDDIRRHLPDFPDVGATVTVRHLLHHISGLRAYESLLMLSGWNRDHPLSRDQALDAFYWRVPPRHQSRAAAAD